MFGGFAVHLVSQCVLCSRKLDWFHLYFHFNIDPTTPGVIFGSDGNDQGYAVYRVRLSSGGGKFDSFDVLCDPDPAAKTFAGDCIKQRVDSSNIKVCITQIKFLGSPIIIDHNENFCTNFVVKLLFTYLLKRSINTIHKPFACCILNMKLWFSLYLLKITTFSLILLIRRYEISATL